MTDEQWFWDLAKGLAIPASQRGKPDNLLGPYPTREAAEHWKEKVEERNRAWQKADEEWAGENDDDDPGGQPA